MDNNQIKNQIVANKIRMVLGVFFILFLWGITLYKDIIHQQYIAIMMIVFTIATIFLYIVKPYKSNKKLTDKSNE